MERFEPAEGTVSEPVANVEDSAGRQHTDAEADGEQGLLPLGEEPLAGMGILPIAGALGATAGGAFGATQGSSGPLLPGASLYPVVAPLTEHGGAGQGSADRVEIALAEDGRLSQAVAGGIQVAISSGVLVLTGHVPTTAERDIAERICASVVGAGHIDNRLSVVPH